MTDYRSALVLMTTVGAEGEKRSTNLFDVWLQGAGWDPDRQILQPTSGHDTLGWQECVVTGCTRPAWGIKNRGLCSGCEAVWRDRREPEGVSDGLCRSC